MKKIKKYLLFTVVFIAISLSGCVSKEENYLESYISISPDDKQIAFAFYKDEEMSIYTAKSDGTDVKRITFPKDEYHLNPEFSPDGSKIAFLSYPKNSKKLVSYLCIINIDGSKIKQLTFDESHVTETRFSHDGNNIYFLKSAHFGSYSPIAREHPHDFDIYAIGIDGSNEKRITHFKAYEMTSLSVSSDGKKLLFCKPRVVSEPVTIQNMPFTKLHFISLENPEEITTIEPKGDFDSESFYNSQFSPTEKLIAFTAVCPNQKPGYQYELYLMNSETREIQQLTKLDSYVSNPRFFHHQEKILFVQDTNWPRKPSKYQLMQINIAGTELTKINLEIH